MFVRSATLQAASVATDGRTIEGVIVPYNRATTVDDGHGPYTEVWAPGSVAPVNGNVYVHLEHGGPLIGRMTAGQHTDDGYRATLLIADTTAGRDAIALVRDGIATGLSVEFTALEDSTSSDGNTVTRVRAAVSAVAIVPRPAYQAAQIEALRSDTTPPAPERTEMTINPTTDAAVDPEPVDEPDELRARAAATTIGRITERQAAPAVAFRSFAEYAAAVRDGRANSNDRDQFARAWTDVITSDIPGLLPPNWMHDIIDLFRSSTVTVDAFRRAALPATGDMTIQVPRLKTDEVALAKQTAQKTEIASGKFEVEVVPFTIGTYAGGADFAIQALRRATPDLLAQWLRIAARTMADDLDIAVAAAIVAGATANTPVNITADDPNKGMIAAAKIIMSQLNRRPEVIVVGTELWETLAAAVDSTKRPLFPSLHPMNPVGSLSLAQNDGQVRDVSVVVDGNFPAGKGVMGTRDAFCSWIGPMGTLSADVPSKLGRDVAVYCEAAFGVLDARGLVVLNAPAPAAQAR